MIAQEGKIIDASFVEAPKQCNSREKKQQIKEGEIPEEWYDQPDKKRQKDVDARWTKKNNQSYYGYKNHAKVDNTHKFIDTYTTTDASVHDSQALDSLLTEKDKDQNLWADSAYTGEEQEKTIKKHNVNNRVHEKGYKNNPTKTNQKPGHE